MFNKYLLEGGRKVRGRKEEQLSKVDFGDWLSTYVGRDVRIKNDWIFRFSVAIDLVVPGIQISHTERMYRLEARKTEKGKILNVCFCL